MIKAKHCLTIVCVVATGYGCLVCVTPGNAQSAEIGKTDAVSAGSQEPSGTHPISDFTRYQIFFQHVSNLQQAADKREKAGNAKAAAGWRSHDQRVAGLDEAEGAVLKNVAEDCNQALQKQEAQARTVIAKIPAEELKARPLDGATAATLRDFRTEREQIIQSHIDSLRSTLGEASFQKLDTYVSLLLKSSVTGLVSVQRHGAKIDTRDTLRRAQDGGAR